MRTTIQLPESLLTEAKVEAARNGQTLTALIEDAIRQRLAGHHVTEPASRFVLPVFEGRGLQPGVDIDDSAALLDLMESDDGTA